MRKELGDGKDTLFWSDCWIDNEVVLSEWTPSGSSLSERMALVCEFVKENGRWDFERLEALIPSSVIS